MIKPYFLSWRDLNRSVRFLMTAMVLRNFLSAPSAAEYFYSDFVKLQRVMDVYADYRKNLPGIDEIDAESAINLIFAKAVVFVDVGGGPQELDSLMV